jgi:hypothetical protein
MRLAWMWFALTFVLAIFLRQAARKHAWGLCWPARPCREAWELSFEA